MTGSTVEKLGFGLSVVLLVFLYGYGVRAFEWFPHRILQRAMHQAEQVVTPPPFGAPQTYERTGVSVVRPAEVQPGFTLIAGHWQEHDGRSGLRLIDTEGRVVHEWMFEPDTLFADSVDRKGGSTARASVHGSHLLPNGDVVFNFNYVGTVRADACGTVVWTLPAGSHHSVEPAEDGTFWIPGAGSRGLPTSSEWPDGFPGLEGPVYHDFLLRVSSDGSVVRRLNVLELLYRNDLERYIPKYFNVQREDVTHLNDIEPLSDDLASEYPMFEAGDLLLSLLHLDLVLVVDPQLRSVKWHGSENFIRQHDADFIGNGWIGVFDNNRDYTPRGKMLGGSRIVAIQPHTDSVRVLFPTSRSEPFYTEMMGKWQQLPNGNRLLTESFAGRVVEVTAEGRTVWEWVAAPNESGRVSFVSEGTRYSLTAEQIEEWPCSPRPEVGVGLESDASARSSD